MRMFGTFAAAAALGLAAAPAPAPAQQGDALVRGQIRPVNPRLTDDAPIGEVEIGADGDNIRVMIDGEGFAPMVHMVHLHGFGEANPRDAECPSPIADANQDGVVDIAETRDAAGVTLVPMTAEPASLEIEADTYPAADDQGELDAMVEMSKQALDAALRDAHGTTAAIPSRVVMFHGVMEGAGVPDGARSVGGLPVRETMPIACAELSAEE